MSVFACSDCGETLPAESFPQHNFSSPIGLASRVPVGGKHNHGQPPDKKTINAPVAGKCTIELTSALSSCTDPLGRASRVPLTAVRSKTSSPARAAGSSGTGPTSTPGNSKHAALRGFAIPALRPLVVVSRSQSLSLGLRDCICSHCGVARFSSEYAGFCCQFGKHAIDFTKYFAEPGPDLLQIYRRDGFNAHSRAYNNLFGLAVHDIQSSSAERETHFSPHKPSFMRIHGTTYRKTWTAEGANAV